MLSRRAILIPDSMGNGFPRLIETARAVARGKRRWLNRLLLGPIIILFPLCAACSTVSSTVNQAPFQKFSNAAQQLNEGADVAFGNGVTWTEAGYTNQLAADTAFQFNSLLLQRTGNIWSGQGQQPLFLEIRQARSALSSANKLLVDYANMLVQLSSADLVSETTFDQMAKDTNTNATAVATDLTTVVKAPSSSEIGLFSTLVAESARLYIEHKRQADLLKVVNGNQPAIGSLAEWCQAALNHLSTDLYTSYSNQASSLGTQFGALGPATGKNLTARRALIQQQLQLNDEFLATQGTISALEAAYAALPKAHADLAKAIGKPGTDLQGIQSLYAEARRLQTLDKELQNSTIPSASTNAAKGK